MNLFDSTIIHFLNSFAQRSETFDSLIVFMTSNVLLRGGIIVVLFWWAWVPTNTKSPEKREFLLFGILASAFGVLFARVLALSLPFRLRPLHDSMVDFKLPYSADPSTLIGWSSFPSDHAVVFFCLAMSLWLVSKRLGAVALIYAVVGTSFPRVYLGIHYPTDILAGAALGIGIACLAKVDWIRNGVVHPMLYWQEHHPPSFAAFLFLFSFEIGEEFASARSLGFWSYHGADIVKQALR